MYCLQIQHQNLLFSYGKIGYLPNAHYGSCNKMQTYAESGGVDPRRPLLEGSFLKISGFIFKIRLNHMLLPNIFTLIQTFSSYRCGLNQEVRKY